mmetsp:Transcript_87243/g.151792  ORF Transcript_87243/g.151792 Transcript_87243/m.151792 type:complete len:209 (-) Transcript_87243:74-700(-)
MPLSSFVPCLWHLKQVPLHPKFEDWQWLQVQSAIAVDFVHWGFNFGVALSPTEETGMAAWQEKQFFRDPKFSSPQPSHFQSVLKEPGSGREAGAGSDRDAAADTESSSTLTFCRFVFFCAARSGLSFWDRLPMMTPSASNLSFKAVSAMAMASTLASVSSGVAWMAAMATFWNSSNNLLAFLRGSFRAFSKEESWAIAFCPARSRRLQ